MHYPGRSVPTGAQLDAVCAGKFGDTVISRLVLKQSLAHFLAAGFRRKTEIGMRESAEVVIELRRKVIGFRLADPPHPASGGIIQLKMMKERPLVIKELGIHGPSPVLRPEVPPN